MIQGLEAAVLRGLAHGTVVVSPTTTGWYVSAASGTFEESVARRVTKAVVADRKIAV